MPPPRSPRSSDTPVRWPAAHTVSTLPPVCGGGQYRTPRSECVWHTLGQYRRARSRCVARGAVCAWYRARPHGVQTYGITLDECPVLRYARMLGTRCAWSSA
eukprot:800568-Rhodomonas_salina.1